jgi:hypothetical protein
MKYAANRSWIDCIPHRNSPKDTTMNAVRMFAFAAAVLMTAFLLRVVSDGLTPAQAAATPTTAAAPNAARQSSDKQGARALPGGPLHP